MSTTEIIDTVSQNDIDHYRNQISEFADFIGRRYDFIKALRQNLRNSTHQRVYKITYPTGNDKQEIRTIKACRYDTQLIKSQQKTLKKILKLVNEIDI